MTKGEIFRCFYPAWHKAFTDQNVASGWSKTGLFPFDPALVLDKLRPRTQKEPTPKGLSGELSSSPFAYWDSASGMRKLRTLINRTVDRKTRKVIKRLSDGLR
jgi:hypothetical protein